MTVVSYLLKFVILIASASRFPRLLQQSTTTTSSRFFVPDLFLFSNRLFVDVGVGKPSVDAHFLHHVSKARIVSLPPGFGHTSLRRRQHHHFGTINSAAFFIGRCSNSIPTTATTTTADGYFVV